MQRTTLETNNTTQENNRDMDDTIKKRRVIALATAAFLLWSGAIGAKELVSTHGAHSLKFSTTTKEYDVQPGDGVWNAAEHVGGVGKVDIRTVIDYIKDIPANAEALSKGLDPHETLVIPVNVKP